MARKRGLLALQGQAVIVLAWFLAMLYASVLFRDWYPHGEYRSGVAVMDITPQLNLPQAGFSSRNRSASGTLLPLRLTVLYLEVSRSPGAAMYIMSYDLIGADRSLTDKIFDRLNRDLGITRNHALLFFSHTHSGPIVGRNLEVLHKLSAGDQGKIDQYAEFLVEASVEAVRNAIQVAEDDCLLWFSTEQSKEGINRRKNAETPLGPLDSMEGPVDHDVPVLTVRRRDFSEKAVVFGYAAHGTVLTTEYRYSNDWISFARAKIEGDLPGATVLFVPGCGGDINLYPRGDVDRARQHGHSIGETVLKTLMYNAPRAQVQGAISCDAAVVDLAYRKLTHSPDSLRRLSVSKSESQFVARLARLLLARLDSLPDNFFRSYPYPIAVCAIGDSFQLVALGGEVVSEYGLRLKAEFHDTYQLFVGAYAGDVMGYVPSKQVVQDGGYEAGERSSTLYGLPGLWGPDVEETIVRTVTRLLTSNKQDYN